jgi:hypothetical protein
MAIFLLIVIFGDQRTTKMALGSHSRFDFLMDVALYTSGSPGLPLLAIGPGGNA